MSRFQVSPLKLVTIVRIELQAAVANNIKEGYSLGRGNKDAFLDSLEDNTLLD